VVLHADDVTELGGARDQKWVQLSTASTAYEQQVAFAYDEVLLEVAARVRSEGSLGNRTSARCCSGSDFAQTPRGRAG
jgi:hypothetical protein